MFYDFEPEQITFFDYSRISSNQVFDIRDFDLELEENEWLKYNIALVYLVLDNSILKAEIKVVTYIDLLT